MAYWQLNFSAFIPSAEDLYLAWFCQAAGLTLLVYNWVLTFGEEMHLIWRTHAYEAIFTARFFFGTARYFPIFASVIATIVSGMPQSNRVSRNCAETIHIRLSLIWTEWFSCTVFTIAYQMSRLAGFLFLTAALAVRAYVSARRTPIVPVVISLVGCASTIISLYLGAHYVPQPLTQHGCFTASNLSLEKYIRRKFSFSETAIFLSMFNDIILIVIVLVTVIPRARAERLYLFSSPICSKFIETSTQDLVLLVAHFAVSTAQVKLARASVLEHTQTILDALNSVLAGNIYLEMRSMQEEGNAQVLGVSDMHNGEWD